MIYSAAHNKGLVFFYNAADKTWRERASEGERPRHPQQSAVHSPAPPGELPRVPHPFLMGAIRDVPKERGDARNNGRGSSQDRLALAACLGSTFQGSDVARRLENESSAP